MSAADRATWCRISVEADAFPDHARRELAAFLITLGDYGRGLADALVAQPTPRITRKKDRIN